MVCNFLDPTEINCSRTNSMFGKPFIYQNKSVYDSKNLEICEIVSEM